jgi:hypothetical protein
MEDIELLQYKCKRLELAVHEMNKIIDQQTLTILHQSQTIREFEKEREYDRLQGKIKEQGF